MSAAENSCASNSSANYGDGRVRIRTAGSNPCEHNDVTTMIFIGSPFKENRPDRI
jgi:hypothetical protein